MTLPTVRLRSALWLLIPLALSPLSFAHAYLDPGTGSYAIQIAIGLIFGATYTLRNFGSKLISRFRSRKDKDLK